MTCLICRKEKDKRHFPLNGPICKSCVEKLESADDVQWSPPEKITINEANLRLLKAIRDTAIQDGELEDWNSYWMTEREWKLLWYILGETSNNFPAETPRSIVL